MDLRNQTDLGYWTDGDNNVIRVMDGGPAAQAGFMVGDRIVMDGGIDVTDTEALTMRARPVAGEGREYVVDRSGTRQTLSLTFGRIITKDVALAVAGFLIGLCFLLFGVRPYLRGPATVTTILAATSVCIGWAFVGPPYFASYALRTFFIALFVPTIYLGLAFLLHFLLAFPTAKAFLARKNARAMLYAPAIAFGLFSIFTTIFPPAGTSAFNVFASAFSGIVAGGYFLLAAVAIVHSNLRASAAERQAHGLGGITLAVVVAVLPIAVLILMGVVAPSVVLPGSEFYFLTLAALPFAFGRAVMRKVGAEAAAPAAAAPQKQPT
jgi:hypothetical protein